MNTEISRIRSGVYRIWPSFPIKGTGESYAGNRDQNRYKNLVSEIRRKSITHSLFPPYVFNLGFVNVNEEIFLYT
jgi:hypothetical protein